MMPNYFKIETYCTQKKTYGQEFGGPLNLAALCGRILAKAGSAPLPEVAGNFAARRHPFGPSTTTRKNRIVIILPCNPWAVGWSPEGSFRRFVWGK